MKNNREGVSRTKVCVASMGGGLFAWLIDWDIFALVALFSVCFALGVRYVWYGIGRILLDSTISCMLFLRRRIAARERFICTDS